MAGSRFFNLALPIAVNLATHFEHGQLFVGEGQQGGEEQIKKEDNCGAHIAYEMSCESEFVKVYRSSRAGARQPRAEALGCF
jgi:hypothetical protein